MAKDYCRHDSQAGLHRKANWTETWRKASQREGPARARETCGWRHELEQTRNNIEDTKVAKAEQRSFRRRASYVDLLTGTKVTVP